MENPLDSPTSPIVNVRQILNRARVDIAESRPILEEGGDTFKAAVVLLLGEHVHFNVDRLTRIGGYDRTFVARAVRRLFDNGVWINGEVKRRWSGSELDDSFWRDVAVAEGLLYRREAKDGELEWGFPGSWWKAYDFGDTSNGSGQAVRYSVAVEGDHETPGPVEDSTVEEREGADPMPEVVEGASEPAPEPAFSMPWESEPSWALGSPSQSDSEVHSAIPLPPVGSTPVGAGHSDSGELFPDAVWLG